MLQRVLVQVLLIRYAYSQNTHWQNIPSINQERTVQLADDIFRLEKVFDKYYITYKHLKNSFLQAMREDMENLASTEDCSCPKSTLMQKVHSKARHPCTQKSCESVRKPFKILSFTNQSPGLACLECGKFGQVIYPPLQTGLGWTLTGQWATTMK